MDGQIPSDSQNAPESGEISMFVIDCNCNVPTQLEPSAVTLAYTITSPSPPVDFQELRITIKPNTVDSSKLSFLRECHAFILSSRLFVEFQHPLRWRRHAGHTLDKNADWLADFDIVGIHGERSQHDYEAYTVAVGIKRDPTTIRSSVANTSKCLHVTQGPDSISTTAVHVHVSISQPRRTVFSCQNFCSHDFEIDVLYVVCL